MMATTEALGAVVRRLMDAENVLRPIVGDPELAEHVGVVDRYEVGNVLEEVRGLKEHLHAQLVKLQGG